MSKVKTKEDLLRFMEAHWACPEATAWVKSRKEETFLEIWNACPSYHWLTWLMYEQDSKLTEEWEEYVFTKYPYYIRPDYEEKRLEAFKRAYRG